AEIGASIHDVATKMRDHHVGILPILENERLVGVITDRDIVVRAIADSESFQTQAAYRIMTAHPITVHEDADTEDAAVLMRVHRLHRIVVVRDNGTVCGVISLTDLSLLDGDALEVLRRLSEKPEDPDS
ncbi:MAG TPA: CBS domain-containing protein, partial [Fimbriimonadaceae bacterium]|nr:CBS domain-containing protein [Fimbriimonadaceae bacterium]